MYTKTQAREIYRDLKGMVGKADYISEEGIKDRIGKQGFDALRKHSFIEYCTTIQGHRMYAL